MGSDAVFAPALLPLYESADNPDVSEHLAAHQEIMPVLVEAAPYLRSVTLARATSIAYSGFTVSATRLRQQQIRPVRAAKAPRRKTLEAIGRWHAEFSAERALAHDPLRFARRYEKQADREIVAMLSALMAFGRVATIGAKLEALLGLLSPSPAQWAVERTESERLDRLGMFRHRTFRGDDIARLLTAAGALLRRDGGLYIALEKAYDETHDLREALGAWTDELRTLGWPGSMTRSGRNLVPDPRGPSASKRWLLLCRWIARPDDGVDLGLSTVPTAALVIPVDVHVHRIARNLGLTRRNDASWTTATEITEALRDLSPDDPVKYDMAICHLGIAQRCPSRRDAARCAGCALQTVCIHWAGRSG